MKVIIDLGNIWEALSAIGTIGAVVVSLYLSRKDSINKIRVSTQVIIPVGSLDKKIYTNVTITNVGRQEVIITQIGVTHSRYAKKEICLYNKHGGF